MTVKIKRTLTVLLTAVFVLLFAAVGAVCLSHNNAVYAADGTEQTLYWGIDNGDFVISANKADTEGLYDKGEFTSFTNGETPWATYRQDIKDVTVKSGVKPNSLAYWFYDILSVETVDMLGIDATLVTNSSSMFIDCPNLKKIKLSESMVNNANVKNGLFSVDGGTWYGADKTPYTYSAPMKEAGIYYTDVSEIEVCSVKFSESAGGGTSEYKTLSEAWINGETITITMLADATVEQTLEVSGNSSNITLDLNGHKITYTGVIGSVIKVTEGASFTLDDSEKDLTENQKHKHTVTGSDGETEIYGGVITGGKADVAENSRGGGVYVNASTFTMNGGTVAGNIGTSFGGGVYVEGGTFDMTGGSVSGNTSNQGGGVCVTGSGIFNMSGNADVSGNKSDNIGGGVYVYVGSAFNMSGGQISGNKADSVNGEGGGVYVSGTFNMTGGVISGNTCQSKGGGVRVSGTFNIEGAVKITGNKSVVGADNNVFVYYMSQEANKKITVTGALHDESGNKAQIGVTPSDYNTVAFTSGYGKNNQNGGETVSPSEYFISDDTATPCVYTDAADEVCFGTHSFITDFCDNCGEAKQIYWGVSDDGKTLTISGSAGDITTVNSFDFNKSFSDASHVAWKDAAATVTHVNIKNSAAPVSMSYWFSGFNKLEAADLSGLDTINVKGMMSLFFECQSLKTVTFPVSMPTPNLDNMNAMFYGCSSLTSVVFPNNFGTPRVDNMYGMFMGCTALTSVDISFFDLSSISDIRDMFTDCTALATVKAPVAVAGKTIALPFKFVDEQNNAFEAITNEAAGKTLTKYVKAKIYWGVSDDGKTLTISGSESDIENLNISSATDKGSFDYDTEYVLDNRLPWDDFANNITKVEIKGGVAPTSYAYWFYAFTKVETIDLSNLDTSNVTDMKGMFCNCFALTSLTFPASFNTGNVTDMSSMFSGCTVLTSLDLSSFNTAKVTDMSDMFYYCFALTSVKLSSFNTENVTNMQNMFFECRELTSLDLSSFNTDGVRTNETGEMFHGCDKLATIKTPAVVGGSMILPAKFENSATGSVYSEISSREAGMTLTKHEDVEQIYWGVSDDGATLTISMLESDITGTVYSFDWNMTAQVPWNSYKDTVTNVEIMAKEGAPAVAPASLKDWFNGFSKLVNVDLSGLDTSKATNMKWMFLSCKALTALDLSAFDTAEVTNMEGMFLGCEALTSVTFSDLFDTRKVNTMDYMFYGCKKLEELNLSAFDTAEVTTMQSMFGGCEALTSLNLSSFDTAKVTNMYSMFKDCRSLTDITFSGTFKADKVKNMSYMFGGCGNLTSLDLSSFNTAEVTNMSGMFNKCGKLKTVSFSDGFTAAKTEGFAQMFDGCKELTAVDLSSFKTDNVNNMSKMFYNCEALTSVTFSGSFNTANVTTMEDMFRNCKVLASLDLSSFDTGRVQVVSGMFTGCDVLKEIKAPKNIDTALPLPDSAEWWNVDDKSAVSGAQITQSVAGKTLKWHGEHTYGWVTLTEATCTQAGSKVERCFCGNENGTPQEIAALGHDVVRHGAKAATCTESGYKAYETCTRCDHTTYEEIAALGHDLKQFEAKAATCGESGWNAYEACTRCDHTTKVEIPATGNHDITHHAAVDATADAAGNAEYWSCEECHKYFSDSAGTTEIVDKSSVEIPKLTPKPAPAGDKKSYVWICWLLIPLAFGAGGVVLGIWLYKRKK